MENLAIKVRAVQAIDEIEAMTENAIKEIYQLTGIIHNDPFDLRFLNRNKPHKCTAHPDSEMVCSQDLDEPCEGCPIWEERDGE